MHRKYLPKTKNALLLLQSCSAQLLPSAKCCMPTSTPPDLHPAIKVPKMNGWRFIGVDILLNSALNAISHEPVSMYCRIYLGSLFVLLSIIIFFIIIYKIYFVNNNNNNNYLHISKKIIGLGFSLVLKTLQLYEDYYTKKCTFSYHNLIGS